MWTTSGSRSAPLYSLENASPFGAILYGQLRILELCRNGWVYFGKDKNSTTGIGDVDYIALGKGRLRGPAKLDALGGIKQDQSLPKDEYNWTLVIYLRVTQCGLLSKEVQTKKYNTSVRNLKTSKS